jgi:hypothetical protein
MAPNKDSKLRGVSHSFTGKWQAKFDHKILLLDGKSKFKAFTVGSVFKTAEDAGRARDQ